MKNLLLSCTALTLAACAAPSQNKTAAEGTRQVQSAALSIAKAKAASQRAEINLTSGEQATVELRKTATPTQRPHLEALERALISARKENAMMLVALHESVPKLENAQTAIDRLAAELALQARNARDYRRLKLWLAFFAATGAAYVGYRMIPIAPLRFYTAGGAAMGAAVLIYAVL